MIERPTSVANRDPGTMAATAKVVADRRVRYERLIVLGQLLPALIVLAFWQLGSGSIVDPVLFGTPSTVVERLGQLLRSRQFYDDLATTLSEIALGYALGALAAILVALLAWRWKAFDRIVQPYIIALNAIPKVALAPLFLIWFGIGIWSKVATAAILVFFLAFYSVYLGLQALDLELVDLARIMGCTERHVTLLVLLPATRPFVLSALRTSLPYAVIGAIIGEFAASTRGIGYRVLYSAGTFDPSGVYAHIVVLVALVLAVNAFFGMLEARLIRWRPRREHVGVLGAALALVALVGCRPAPVATVRPTDEPPAGAPAARPAPPGGRSSVKLAQAGEVLAYSPVAVAVGAELFKEQGLEVERSIVQGGVGVTTAVQAGDVQFGAAAVDVFSTGVGRGLPLIAVFGLMNQVSLDLIVSNAFLHRKGISPGDPLETRLKALVGGRFGAISLGGASDQHVRYLVKKAGGHPQADIEIVVLGSPQQLLAGLRQGLVDGFLMSPPVGPTVEAEGIGRILIGPADLPEYRVNQFSVLFTTREYAGQNGAAVRSAVTALSKASAILADDSGSAADLLLPFYPSVSRALLQASVERYRSAFAPRGRMSVEGWQNGLMLIASLSDGSSSPSLDARNGESVWWTNEFLR